MHVHSLYKGDNNEAVMFVQHHLYAWLSYDLFGFCKSTFLKCDAICNKLSVKDRDLLLVTNSFDHRTLQVSHDMIAAGFRFNFTPQISLFEPSVKYILDEFNLRFYRWQRRDLSDLDLIVAYHWVKFYYDTLDQITSINSKLPNFIYHVVNAAHFNPNNPIGSASEAQLTFMLREYFKLPD